MTDLIQTAVHQHAAAAIIQLFMIFGPFLGYCYITLLWLPLDKLTRKAGVKLLVALGATGLMFVGLEAINDHLTRAAKPDVVLTTSVVEAALARPELATVTYQANTAALTVASTILGVPGHKATLPIALVAKLTEALSGQIQPRPAPLVKSNLEQHFQPVLEQAYVRWSNRLWLGGLIVGIGLFGGGVYCQGQLGHKLTLMVPWMGLLVGQLYANKCDVQARQGLACAPTAAVVAKAFMSPDEVTWFKPAKGGWQLKATVPQAFLCPANNMTVVADLSPDLCRQLNAAAAVLGYAPLKVPQAPTPDQP